MLKLLLVEDDKIIASIYQRKFTVDGFHVHVCNHGNDAIPRLDEVRPDIVILDLMLPGMNGIDILRHIRATPAFAELPVVVFSNAYQSKMIEDAWQAGASAVLMKANTNPRTMTATIRELLKQSPPAETSAAAAATEPEPVLKGLPAFIAGFEKLHDEFLATDDPPRRLATLLELSRATKGLSGSSSAVGMTAMARVAEAYHALLQEMHDRPEAINDSTRRTSTIALDLVRTLAKHDGRTPLDEAQPQILLVDSNDFSKRLALFAFQKMGADAVTTDYAETALTTVTTRRFDLVALDHDVSGTTAAECARQLRNGAFRDGPVILIFPVHEFAHELPATEAIRADLIAKPYPAAELALLALCRIYAHRLTRARS